MFAAQKVGFTSRRVLIMPEPPEASVGGYAADEPRSLVARVAQSSAS